MPKIRRRGRKTKVASHGSRAGTHSPARRRRASPNAKHAHDVTAHAIARTYVHGAKGSDCVPVLLSLALLRPRRAQSRRTCAPQTSWKLGGTRSLRGRAVEDMEEEEEEEEEEEGREEEEEGRGAANGARQSGAVRTPAARPAFRLLPSPRSSSPGGLASVAPSPRGSTPKKGRGCSTCASPQG